MKPANLNPPLFALSVFGASPDGWLVDRIKDHLTAVVGGEWGDDPDAHDEGILIPVVRVADIRGIDLNIEGLTIRRVKESKLSGRLIGARTVLLEKSGGGELTPVGRAVRCRSITFDAICSNFMAKIDCGPGLDPSFLVYLLDALYTCGVNGACIQQTTGIQNIRVTDYLSTKVAFPFLPEQKRIAAYLDVKCSLIDAVVSTTTDNGTATKGVLNRQNDALLAYRKSLIHECVTGQRRITEKDLNRIATHA